MVQYVNRQLNKKTVKFPRLKIDRLTILFTPINPNQYFDEIQEALGYKLYPHSGKLFNRSCDIKKYGIYFQCQPHRNSRIREYIRIDFQVKALRSSANIKKIFKIFVNPHVQRNRILISRLDICVDYPVDYEIFLLSAFFSSRKTKTISSGAKIETTMFGGEKSRRIFKIYDKGLEKEEVKLKEHEQMTRIEYTHRWSELKERLLDLRDVTNPFYDLITFEVPGIPPLEFPNNFMAEVASCRGLSAVKKGAPPNDYRVFLGKLKRVDGIEEYPVPAQIFAEQWRSTARKFLRKAQLIRKKRN